MRLHLTPCLLAALTFCIPAASADGINIEVPVPAEVYDNRPPLPDHPGPPIDTPNIIQCGGVIAKICVILQPTPCYGIKAQAYFRVYPDGSGVGVYVEVGAGGPGGYGGYSERC
jgi:hypothetical protein